MNNLHATIVNYAETIFDLAMPRVDELAKLGYAFDDYDMVQLEGVTELIGAARKAIAAAMPLSVSIEDQLTAGLRDALHRHARHMRNTIDTAEDHYNNDRDLVSDMLIWQFFVRLETPHIIPSYIDDQPPVPQSFYFD